MDQNDREIPGEALAALLQFLNREQPSTPSCEICGGDDQVDLESHICSDCQKLSQEDVEEFEQEEQSEKDTDVELSDEEETSEEEASDIEQIDKIDDIMKPNFDALTKNKNQSELVQIASLLIRRFKHKDFAEKATKLLKLLEGIWTADTKRSEKKNDRKCANCKKEKTGERIGRCGKCYDKVRYWRKRLNPKFYKKCSDCSGVKFLGRAGRCGTCYNKYLAERNSKKKSFKKASKPASSPIKRPIRTTRNSLRARNSEFFKDSEHSGQPDTEQEPKRKQKPSNGQQPSNPSKRPKLSIRQESSQPNDVLHEELNSRPKKQTSMPRQKSSGQAQSSGNKSSTDTHQHPLETFLTPPSMIKCFNCHKLVPRDELSSKNRICMGCFTISLIANSRSDHTGSSSTGHDSSPIFNCFGCRKSISQDELSPKDRICMGCFTVSLVVNSRRDHVENS